MRPPIDTTRAHTIISQTAARKRLAIEFEMPRHETLGMTLDQLHDALSKRIVEGRTADFVVVTDRVFRRISEQSETLLRRYHGGDVERGAGISSLSSAMKAFEDAGVTVPPDAPILDLEDALSGLNNARQIILTDDDFEAYGLQVAMLLAGHPSGRAA